MSIVRMLGGDQTDPRQQLALDLMRADSELIDQLVRIRKSRMTQQQLAEVLGTSQSAVARFESGDRDPHLSTLRRYALAVEASVTHNIVDDALTDRPDRVAWVCGPRQSSRHESADRRASWQATGQAPWAPVGTSLDA